MRITAVVPTKNRPGELVVAVASIIDQRRKPDEIIIIDQSTSKEGVGLVANLASSKENKITLTHLHDPSISGLVHAKKVSVSMASGDVICFLEDDEVLDPGYFEEIRKGFEAVPDMMGCCGLVKNLPTLPQAYVILFHFFHRGVFHDQRVGVHGYISGTGHKLIPSRYLSGGLSAYRREVFHAVPFDIANNFFMLEDIDFSTRAVARFGPHFYINPNAQLEHHMSAANRSTLGARQRRKVREFLVYYKKVRQQTGALPALILLLPGLFLEAMYQSFRSRRFAPVGGFFLGLLDGMRWRIRNESE